MTPQQQPPTGIPGWLSQFLNSQGGMQGLLYQYGGIQGLLNLIQQQSQPQAQPPPREPPADPWRDLLQAHQPPPLPANNGPFPSTADILTRGRPTNGSTNPNVASYAGYEARPQYIPSYQTPTGSWTNPSLAGSIPLTQAEMDQFMGQTGVTGQAFYEGLPDKLKPTGVTDAIRNEYNAADSALRAAMQAGNVTPELQARARAATTALNMGQYGPLYQIAGSGAGLAGSKIQPGNMLGGGGVYVPQVKDRRWHPSTQADLAAVYGYAPRSVVRDIPTGVTGQTTTRADYQPVDSANIMQTLKHMGWTPGTGAVSWTQQPGAINPQTGQPFTPAQAQMFKDLQASIAPRSAPKDWNAVMGFNNTSPLPEAPDPFVGMQSAINRDAYVNDTLGGGFFGGVIPDQDAINTFGDRDIGGAHDPHFPTPQLALNPLPGQSKYDTYAGWAADQGAAFGTAPWASDSQWGQAMGYNDPKLYQQPPPPPTAWQPTPQFGQNNAWSGTMGWGNTSRNGQNAWNTSSTQQQPMTFGNSPWGNPWGMP